MDYQSRDNRAVLVSVFRSGNTRPNGDEYTVTITDINCHIITDQYTVANADSHRDDATNQHTTADGDSTCGMYQ